MSKRSLAKRVPRKARRLETMQFNSFGNPMPVHADVEFKYVDRITIDAAGSGAIASYLFSANGMYDPDISGTGHQPLGFDQWLGTSSTTGFYNHYTVTSSKIRLQIWSQAADNTGLSIVTCGFADDTTTGTDFNNILENPTFTRTCLGAVGSGHDVASLEKTFDASKYFGLTRESLYAKDSVKGNQAANPSEQAYFLISNTSAALNQNPASVTILVEIIYKAHLTERKELPGS